MAVQFVSLILCALIAGCAHHQVGRPPSAAEIAAINDTPETGAAAITVYYLADSPRSEVRRIVAADDRQLTVLAASGENWHLDMSKVAGVTRPARVSVRGTVTGGVVGLLLGGLAVVAVDFVSTPEADSPNAGSPGHPLSAEAALGTMLVFTIAGAIVGAIVDHRSPTIETFDFGGGHGFDPSGLHR
ncbi:MAG: hypothetical protein ACJ8F1_13000 [Polyangia bacterium]